MGRPKYTTFGTMIHDARVFKRDWTLEQLAKRTGTHKGYISGIERGQVNPPSPAVCRKLAKVLELSADTLVALSWVEKRPRGVKLSFVISVWPNGHSPEVA